MKFVLSGEGPTDIGTIDNYTRSFEPGPMTYFIDAIVREKTSLSFIERHNIDGDVIYFIPKQDLKIQAKKVPSVLPGKKSPQGTSYFTKNASTLGNKAKEIARISGLPTVAVLYKDADPTRSHDDYHEKLDSVIKGFELVGFYHGVPMMPRQIMESWLLDSLDWQGESHPNFETVVGGRNSAYSYKEKLEEKVGNSSRQRFVDLVNDGTFNQNRITACSYKRFKRKLEEIIGIIGVTGIE